MVQDLAKHAYYVTKQIRLTSWNHRMFSEMDSDQQTSWSYHPGPDQAGPGHTDIGTRKPPSQHIRSNGG